MMTTDEKKNDEATLKALQLPEPEGRLKTTQEQAREKFLAQGLPGSKNEDYKYTSFTEILESGFTLARTPGKAEEISPLLEECYRLVFIDGHFQPAISDQLPEMVEVSEISNSHLAEEDAQTLQGVENQVFSQLALASLQSGLSLTIKKEQVLDKPIYIQRLSSQANTFAPSVVLIKLESRSKASIIEHCQASHPSWALNLVKIQQEESSTLDHALVQGQSTKSFIVERIGVSLAGHASYSNHNLQLGSKLSRNDINVVFEEPGGYANLTGITRLNGTQHVDNQTFIHHKVPACESREVYHNIVDDSSKAVFNGKVLVAVDAQQTNADQLNKTILLSDEADVYSKPQLEIYADDVKCTHGATIGRLDENAYFYLRTRGISQEQARSLLVSAFAHEIIDQVKQPELAEALKDLVNRKAD